MAYIVIAYIVMARPIRRLAFCRKNTRRKLSILTFGTVPDSTSAQDPRSTSTKDPVYIGPGSQSTSARDPILSTGTLIPAQWTCRRRCRDARRYRQDDPGATWQGRHAPFQKLSESDCVPDWVTIFEASHMPTAMWSKHGPLCRKVQPDIPGIHMNSGPFIIKRLTRPVCSG